MNTERCIYGMAIALLLLYAQLMSLAPAIEHVYGEVCPNCLSVRFGYHKQT